MPDYSMNEIAKLAGHKPYDSESEWQPAIFIEAHPDGGPHVPYGTKCFVKPNVPTKNSLRTTGNWDAIPANSFWFQKINRFRLTMIRFWATVLQQFVSMRFLRTEVDAWHCAMYNPFEGTAEYGRRKLKEEYGIEKTGPEENEADEIGFDEGPGTAGA